MSLTVITPPIDQAVSVDEAKQFLRIGEASDDALVRALNVAAQLRIEAATGVVLVRQVLKRRVPLDTTRLAGQGLRLRPGPDPVLVAVDLIRRTAPSEDVSDCFIAELGRLRFADGVTALSLQDGIALDVRFQAGFTDPASVPGDLKLAIQRLTAEAYARRGLPGDLTLETGLPEDVAALLAPYQEVRL